MDTVFEERRFRDGDGNEVVMSGGFVMATLGTSAPHTVVAVSDKMAAGVAMMRAAADSTRHRPVGVGDLLSWAACHPLDGSADWQRAGDIVVNRYLVFEALRLWLVRGLVTSETSIGVAVIESVTPSSTVFTKALSLRHGAAWTVIQEGRPSACGSSPLPALEPAC